jgi:hypothetical protein
MTPQITELIERIRLLQEELEVELAKKRAELRFTLIDRKVRFEQEMLKRHREIRIGLFRYVVRARLRSLISAPVIYAMIVPLVALDLCVSVYQWVCFPLYRIPRVKRRDYLIFDRHNLAYLNLVEKINCAYCSYGNGLLSYIKEIVARTEQYWCPIKHAQRVLQPHSRYSRFVDFGDAEAYRRELKKLRCDFRNGEEYTPRPDKESP